MNAKISEFVICVEAIIYLLLYNLLDCNFNGILRLFWSKYYPQVVIFSGLKFYEVNLIL